MHLCTHSRTILEPHSQGNKHPPSDQTQTINAAQVPFLGPTNPKLDPNNSARSTLPRRSSTHTVLQVNPQHKDTLERPMEGKIEVLDINFNEDVNLEVEHNSGFLRPSSSLNSTLAQCEDLDRADRLLRAQYLQHQGKRPRSQSTPTEDEFLNIKTSTHNHLLYGLQRPRSNSEAQHHGSKYINNKLG